MKTPTYDELKAEVEQRKRDKLDILGPCCSCGVNVLSQELHETNFDWQEDGTYDLQYCCQQCSLYTEELMIFFALLACVQGKKSWEIFRFLAGKDNV